MASERKDTVNATKRKDVCNNNQVYGFEQCAKCGGSCCKTNACAYVPEDVPGGISKENIESMIDQHVAMIYGTMVRMGHKIYTPSLYLSAPEKSHTNGVKVSIIHSPCALLTRKGCILPVNKRPLQGLALIPNVDGTKCESVIDFDSEVIDEWEKYRDILEEIVLKRTKKTAQELLDEELYSKKYTPFVGYERVSLPMYLKQQVQYSFLCNGQPITVWEYTALTVLLEHRFFADHLGLEIENVIRDMLECMMVIAV